MTRAEKKLARVAHHEAGHAVMAAWLLMTFDTVSIEPAGFILGRVSKCRQPNTSTVAAIRTP